MKRKLISVASLIAASLPAFAQDSGEDIHASIDFSFVSAYVFRGVQKADGSGQINVGIDAYNFYGGVFGNQPIEDDNELQEINLYLGYYFPFEVADIPLVVDAGMIIYEYRNVPVGGNDRSLEFYVGGKADIDIAENQKVGGRTYLFYDTDLETITLEGSAGYRLDWEIPFPGTKPIRGEVAVSGYLGYSSSNDLLVNTPGDQDEQWTYYGFSAEVPWHINSYTTLTVGLAYGNAESYDKDLYEGFDDFWGKVGLTVAY